MMALCRARKLPVGSGLMALSFATILGGMTTLVGTPANLILSSVREDQLGAGFHFFDMSRVGLAVTVVGVVYLSLIGWRLTPRRRSASDEGPDGLMVLEGRVPPVRRPLTVGLVRKRAAKVDANVLALFRGDARSQPERHR